MTKVLIVDDELLVRVGIKSSVDWESHGFEIIAEAGNGEEAMAVLRQQAVDIVLMDINMPLMNGIQVLESMKREKIEAAVIILSCHEDFNYAQQALKLGAKDYVLKLSINSEKLLELLLNTRKSIRSAPQDKKHLPLQEEWDRIAKREKPFDLSQLRDSGSRLQSRRAMVFVFTVEKNSTETVDKPMDQRLFTQTVRNLLSDILNDYGTGDLYVRNDSEFAAVLNMNQEGEETIKLMLEDISKAFQRYMKLSVSVVYNYPSAELDRFPVLLNSLMTLLERRFILGPGIILSLAPDHAESPVPKLLFHNKMEEKLEKSIEFGNKIMALDTLMEYFNTVSENSDSFKRSRFNRDVNEILHIYSKELKLYDQQFQNIEGYGAALPERTEMIQFHFISDVIVWFESFSELYFNHLNELRKNSRGRNLDDCLDYIHAHIKEDLNAADLAEKLNVSANYFGTLFKKQMGLSLKQYLTDYRMKLAKELLRTTNKSVTEISEEIGYDNIFYFSTVFKKEFSVSPNIYRKQLLDDASP